MTSRTTIADNPKPQPEEKDRREGADSAGPFASLGLRNFRFLLTGTVFSNAAMWIQQVTLSWLVYDLTGSGTMLGSINAVRAVAGIAMVLVAGALIDRLMRRRLMLATNAWMFAISVALGLILVLGYGNIEYLFVFAFLGGLAQTVDNTLRQVVVFDLVPRAGAPNAVALVQTGWSLMRSLGPFAGAFLILWFGAGGNFLIQAGAYALITISIMQIRFPPREPGQAHASPLRNIKEGFQYVVKAKITRTFALMGFVLPLFIIPIYNILPPIYAKDIFQGEADILGFLMASVGVGGILGGIVVASLRRVERRGVLQLGALFMTSLTLVAFALSEALWVALLMLGLSGFFEMVFLTTNQTLLQLSIPDGLRGRVTSVVNLNMVLHPLGGFIAGVGSDLFGGPRMITILLAGAGAAVAVCVFLFSPTVRNYRLSRAINAG